MSHVPIAPSSHYKAQGMRPIYVWGLVIWLTPLQYQQVLEVEPDYIQDATDEQVARHDAWYEQAQEERRRENADWDRLFKLMGGER